LRNHTSPAEGRRYELYPERLVGDTAYGGGEPTFVIVRCQPWFVDFTT
jgi:hypothetical protein